MSGRDLETAALDVNPDDHDFARIAVEHGGAALRAAAAHALPALVAAIGAKLAS